MQHQKLETPSCTNLWCLLGFSWTCPIKASAVKPCPMPTLSCQSTCKSTNTGCLFLTLVRRCNPRKMRIKLCLSMPICASKTFGEMVEHMCEQAEAKVIQSSCAVLTLASCGRPCKISCRNPHMRQQSLYDRWTYKFSHAFKLPSTSPMIIGPPGTPMFRSNFAEKVYLRTMGNWVGMEQFQGQIALLIPTKIDHQGRPRMTKSWIQPIWQFVETQV